MFVTLHTSSGRSRRVPADRRGAALLFSLLVLMVISMVGMALASTMLQSLYLTRLQENSAMAFNVAESGAERALLWLRQQPAPPVNTAPFDPFGGSVALGRGAYRVTITPAPGNATGELRQFTVRARGTALARQETVELFVQQANFGRYAYFTDYERSAVSNALIYFKTGEVIDGPVHSNNSEGSDFHISWINSTASIFKDRVTAVSNNVVYSPTTPGSEAEFQKIYEEGSRGFRLGVNRIEMPENTDRQKVAAWGAPGGFPSTSGVHIPASGAVTAGGLFIVGDSGITFSVTAEGWQQIAITQGGNTTTVTIKRDLDQTTVQRGGTTTNYTGTTNGVIYTTGNVTGLSGQLADSEVAGGAVTGRNAFTLATDVTAGKNVTLTGNLTYQTQPDKTRDWDDPVNLRAAALGVVARNISIGAAAPRNLAIHGVMLAGGRYTDDGSFSAANYNTRQTGTLNLIGGLIQKKRGPVGTFNSSTGQQNSGYSKNYVYDRRMAVNPPPFFPTTGTYERLSWKRLIAGPA